MSTQSFADGAGAAPQPAVSVLMPMRNPGRFVQEAIASVLACPHPPLELLVIDDGSTDGSREYVAGLADPRVRLVDGPRAGISACLNRGLEAARGDILMRCDADDLFPAGRIAAQVAWLGRHPRHAAVCGAFSMIASDGATVAHPLQQETAAHDDVAPRILAGGLRTHLCTFAFRRSAAQRIGGFRAFFETAEDIDFALRLASAGPVGFLPDDAYLYRLHDASVTHTQASARRRFFEDTAYAMGRDRLATGSDALMRGEAPVPPAAQGAGHRADGARLQMAQLLVGTAWRAFAEGNRVGARQAAARAILARPSHAAAWKALLLVSVRRPRRG